MLYRREAPVREIQNPARDNFFGPGHLDRCSDDRLLDTNRRPVLRRIVKRRSRFQFYQTSTEFTAWQQGAWPGSAPRVDTPVTILLASPRAGYTNGRGSRLFLLLR